MLTGLHIAAALAALVVGSAVLARRKGTRAHKAFMIGTFLGLAGAGVGALAPGRALYRFLFA